MDNTRYIAPDEASVYTLKEVFNIFIDDLFEDGLVNLLSNPDFRQINDDGNGKLTLVGWDKDFVGDVTDTDLFRVFTLNQGQTFSQKITKYIEPNKFYTLIFRGNVTQQLEMNVAGGDADLINLLDLTQIDYAKVFIDANGEYSYLVFKTNEMVLTGEEIIVTFTALADNCTVNLRNIMLKEGWVQFADMPSRSHLENNTRYNNGIWEVTNDGINWHKMLIDDSSTANIIRDYMYQMVDSNIENGISVTYDSINHKMNFDVDDFILTFGGDVTGSETITNLSGTTINLIVKDNSHTHLSNNIVDMPETVQDIVGGMVSGGNLEYGISATYDDVYRKLNFDVADWTLNLTGDISGNVTITNLGNAILSAKVLNYDHSHIGEYLTTGDADSTFVKRAGDIVNGDLTIEGNLFVLGDVTSVQTSTLAIADNVVTLNSNLTSGTAPITLRSGIEVLRGDAPTVTMQWNEYLDFWELTEDGVNFEEIASYGQQLDTYIDTKVSGFISDSSTIIWHDNVNGSLYADIRKNTAHLRDNPMTGLELVPYLIENTVGAMVSSNTETGGIAVTYNATAHKLNFSVDVASQVTYENLLGNGDVGSGATQVSKGDHNHSGTYNTIAEITSFLSTKSNTDHTHAFSGYTEAEITTMITNFHEGKINGVSMRVGIIANGGTIPLPDGYLRTQCVAHVSPYRIGWGGGSNVWDWDDDEICYVVHATGVVTHTHQLSSNNTVGMVSNYIIIGVR